MQVLVDLVGNRSQPLDLYTKDFVQVLYASNIDRYERISIGYFHQLVACVYLVLLSLAVGTDLKAIEFLEIPCLTS